MLCLRYSLPQSQFLGITSRFRYNRDEAYMLPSPHPAVEVVRVNIKKKKTRVEVFVEKYVFSNYVLYHFRYNYLPPNIIIIVVTYYSVRVCNNNA